MANDDHLDPIHKLADLAKLRARLSEPFAEAGSVHAGAGTSHQLLLEAEARWKPELAKNPALPVLYAQVFKRERDRLREIVTAPVASADETALGSVATLARPLPFVEGEYRPEPLPVARRPVSDADPDATMLPTPGQMAALPFGGGRGKGS